MGTEGSRLIPSPHPLSKPISGDGMRSGVRMAMAGQRWMEAHQDSFYAIYSFVKSMQAGGQMGRVRDRVAVFCAERGIEVGDGGNAFANAYWACISRYLVLYDRSLLYAPIEFRDSEVDGCGLMPVSWLRLEVGR